MRTQLTCLLALTALIGCASPLADDPGVDETAEVPGDVTSDRPVDGETPTPTEVDPADECACDVTDLCDEGCFCDIACSAPDVSAPIGEHYTMLGRAETLLLSSGVASTPLSNIEAFDDTWVPTTAEEVRDGRPAAFGFAPMGDLTWSRPALTSVEGLWAYRGRVEAFAADVDDDGSEEVLVADGAGLHLIQKEGAALARSMAFPAWSELRRVTAGDLDGDRVDEAVLATILGGDLTIHVLDLDPGHAGVSATLALGPTTAASIATGNVDADPEIELVVARYVTAGASAELLVSTFGLVDGVLVEEAREGVSSCRAERFNPFAPERIMADLAVTTHELGEGLPGDSMAVAFRCNEDIGVLQLDVEEGEIVVEAARQSSIGGVDAEGFDRLRLSGGHPEIAAVTYTDREVPQHRIYVAFTEFTEDYTFGLTSNSVPEARLIEVDPSRSGFYDIELDAPSSVMPSLTVSDTNLDGQADLSVTFNTLRQCASFVEGCADGGLTALTPDELHVVRVERGAHFSLDYASYPAFYEGYRVTRRIERRIAESPRTNPWVEVDRYWGAPLVIAADLDGDSVRLRATGEIVKHQSNPRVQALLAAAPIWSGRDGIEQEGATTFGNARCTGRGVGDANTMSASASITVGADILGIVEVSATTTLGYEYETSHESETTECITAERTSDAADDVVVYFVTPVASHVYEVVAHPNAGMIGQEWTIDVPGEPVDTSLELTRFRQRYGDLADALIPPDLFTHIVGDPSTYPAAHVSGAAGNGDCNQAALSARVAGVGRIEHPYYARGLKMVGSTEDSLSVSIGQQDTTSETTTFGAEQSFSAEAFGNGAEATFGLSDSATTTTTLGSEVTYTGTVAPIIGSDSPEDRYEWGLCVYNYVAADGSAAYPVVDYVVRMPR